jgi:hypothetical protein
MPANVQLLRLAALSAFAGLGLAQVPAVTSFTGNTNFGDVDTTNQTLGFRFTANQNIVVSALGVWQQVTTNNLSQTHQVGLWASDGSLLASATVAVNSPLTGNWRYVAITPVTLTAGQTYVAGSAITSPFTDTYARVNPTGSITTNPLISIVSSGLNPSGGGFSFPGNPDPAALARLGPNLMVQAAPSTPPTSVPISPLALVAAGIGLALVAAFAMGTRRPAQPSAM